MRIDPDFGAQKQSQFKANLAVLPLPPRTLSVRRLLMCNDLGINANWDDHIDLFNLTTGARL